VLDPSCPGTRIKESSHTVHADSSLAHFLGFPLTKLRPLFALRSMAPRKKPSKRLSPVKSPATPQSTTPHKANPYQTASSFRPVNRAIALSFPLPYRQPAMPSSSSIPTHHSAGTVPYSLAQWFPAGQAPAVPDAPIVSPLQMAGSIKQETGTPSDTTFPWQQTRLSTVGECYAELGWSHEEGNDVTFDVRVPLGP
jgi:hypothetical protein